MAIVSSVKKGIKAVFGSFSWQAPPWFLAIKRLLKARPRLGGMLLLLLFSSAILLHYTYHWYQSRPQPIAFDVRLNVPKTPSINNATATPSSLHIAFAANPASLAAAAKHAQRTGAYQSVDSAHALRLDMSNKDLQGEVSIVPFVEGRWHSSETGLTFTPNKQWPADSTYTLNFSPTLFLDNVKLTSAQAQFSTAKLRGKVSSSELSADPRTPSELRFLSTLEFTHPVDPTSLQAQLKLRINDPDNKAAQRDVGYQLTADPELKDQAQRRYFVVSDIITLRDETQFVRMALEKGLQLANTASYLVKPEAAMSTDLTLHTDTPIPSVADYFTLQHASVDIVRDEHDNPQQALLLELSDSVGIDDLHGAFELLLLPIKDPQNEYDMWSSAAQISADVEARAVLLKSQALPTEHDASQLFSFVFDAPENRQLLVRLKKGLTSRGGFTLSRDISALMTVPEYPKELSIMGSGSVLNRTGSHQLGLVSRGLAKLHVSIAQVRTDSLNHLISQSNASFTDPEFNPYFSPDDIAVVSEVDVKVANESAGKPSYSSINLSQLLAQGDLQTGVFYIDAAGVDESGSTLVSQQRMVLITDIGFLVKRNSDGTREVFVQSTRTAQPLANAQVSVLAKNGLVLLRTSTDEQGHAIIENTDDFERDQTPVAIMVENEGDMAYMPIDNEQRRLNTSRFDTGGFYIESQRENAISAYLFSDRGIYRPGESVKLGLIVRQTDLQQTASFPVSVIITDPRGTQIYEKQHLLPPDGFFEIEQATMAHSATGEYQVNVFLSENNRNDLYLGGTTFSVEEFQADRLKISSSISADVLQQRQDASAVDGRVQGWFLPNELAFSVSLQNLFGTPASERKINAAFQLERQAFSFSSHPDYRFSDATPVRLQDVLGENYGDLPEQLSDEQGNSVFTLAVDDLQAGTYQLNFETDGYEQDGGRSVSAQQSVLFSPRDYLIGYKTDANLAYLKRDQPQSLALLCINRFAQTQDCADLTLRVTQKTTVSTLVKQANGGYQYQSIPKSEVMSSEALLLASTGYTHSINTQEPGQYVLDVLDATGSVRQSLEYQVIGEANISAELEKDARLEMQLNKAEYAAGELIELQINAPYTGSGLITIESNKTHQFVWFTANSKQSVQHIRVPEGLQANAYVQVSFVRSTESQDIFSSPLSYAIAPFAVSRKPYQMQLELAASSTVKPGESLAVKVKSDKPSRVVVFAVDQGILQVADYQTPNPLDYFLQKRALQVDTYQMFDLLLPEYALLHELSATGGGEDMALEMSMVAGNLNPFSRKVKKAVAFWSGITEVGPEGMQLEIPIPDYFDGTLRLMAVAVNEIQFAQAQQDVIVRGPYVLTPNTPTVVAPGDTFDVVLGVSNQLQGSGGDAQVAVSLQVSEHLQVLGEATQQVGIAEGAEQSVVFSVQAGDHLGSAEMQFSAKAILDNPVVTQRRVSASLSVRPASLLRLSTQSGFSEQTNTVVPLPREMLTELADTRVYASTDPSLLMNGLVGYLEAFPHACTEQIVSQASPLLAFLNHPNYLGTAKQKHEKLQSLLLSLRDRQLFNGGFSLWPGGYEVAQMPSVQAVHLMLDAQELGIDIPHSVLEAAIAYLKALANEPENMRRDPELVAYALYLLTRTGEQTNNYWVMLVSVLDDKAKQDKPVLAWQQQLQAVYIAASYRLLQREQEAVDLLHRYSFNAERPSVNEYDSALYRDSMALYLTAKHFPEELKQSDSGRVQALVKPILSGNINTLSSGRALLALNAYSEQMKKASTDVPVAHLSVSDFAADATNNTDPQWYDVPFVSDDKNALYPMAQLAPAARQLRMNSQHPQYYQVMQKGFDRKPPEHAQADGLEVVKLMTDVDGNALNAAPEQGDDVFIQVRVRSTDNRTHNNVAIIDLLPGGFDIDRASVRDGLSWQADYIDIREDRLLYYGSVGPNAVNITYKARLTTRGEFVVPAVYAQAMYDEQIQAHSAVGQLTVVGSSGK